MEAEHVRLPQHHPRLLRQLRHGVGRRGRIRHRVQQVPAEALAEAARVPPRHALRHQPGRLRLDADRRRRVDRSRSSAALGEAIRPYSPLVAIGLALVLPPIFAIATKGKYYLRRTDDGIDLPMYDEYGNPSGEHLNCHVCHHDYERPDMIEVRDARRVRLLAVPEHRQGRRPRAARTDLATGEVRRVLRQQTDADEVGGDQPSTAECVPAASAARRWPRRVATLQHGAEQTSGAGCVAPFGSRRSALFGADVRRRDACR